MNQEQLHYRVTGDAKGFKGAINQSQQSLNGFQNQIKNAASSLQLLFVGALTAAGYQAVRSARHFDKSMTQIKSLVGVAGDEVDRMGEIAKSMARETGVSANDAAEALFFITSAGLEGAEAMDVLEASMKAASVGLGETKTVADLATSALNAYGSENLSAIEATDILTASVREGKLEASELAGSMGRVIPIASSMGVSFNEVGAAFASMSRTGTNASEAATQLLNILVAINKPTAESKKQLAELGLSTEGLRKQIREKGLLNTLETLKDKFEGNVDAQNKVFGGTRAMMGVMDLLGSNVEGTREIFEELNSALGSTNTAFEIAAESAETKLSKALNELSISGTELGSKVLPIIANMAQQLVDALNGTSYYTRKATESQEEFNKIIENANNLLKDKLNNTEEDNDAQEESNEGTKKAIVINEEHKKILAKLDTQIKDITNRNVVFGNEVDISSEKISAYQNTMVSLLNAGMKPTADEFQKLKTEVDLLNQSFIESDLLAGRYSEITNVSTKSSQEFSNSLDSVNAAFTDLDTFVMTGVDLGSLFQNAIEPAKELKDATEVLNEGFKQIAFSVASSFVSMATSSDKSIREIVHNLAKMIAQMTAALVIQTALRVMMGDITAGAQLAKSLAVAGAVVAGSGVLAMATKPQEFATGGIVTSPMMGIVGEAGAEAIIPLNRLPQIMQASQGKQTGEFMLRGQDLILALERAGDFRARVTG